MRAIAVGVLGIVAVGLAASTLSSTLVTRERSGDGTGLGGDGGSASGPPAGDAPREVLDVPWLGELLYAAFVVLLLGLLAYAAYNHRRKAALVTAVAIALLATVWLLTEYVTIPVPEPRPEPPSGASGNGTGGSRGGQLEGVETPQSPVVGLALVVLAVVGLVVAVASSPTRRAAVVDRLTESDDDVAALGRAAGRAANRLGDAGDAAEAADAAEFENEVYRAWREMTASLDVDRPESSTPGEFADAAIDAGMSADDVRELTALFEAVRYGGRRPTEERQRRARRLFRRLEATYTGEGSGP